MGHKNNIENQEIHRCSPNDVSVLKHDGVTRLQRWVDQIILTMSFHWKFFTFLWFWLPWFLKIQICKTAQKEDTF